MKNVDRIVVDHINNRWEANKRQSKSYDILFIDADSLRLSNGGRLPNA